jgi:hypothetical protein
VSSLIDDPRQKYDNATMAYLVESNQGEHAVIRKLQGLLPLLTEFFTSLNLNSKYCWFLLEVEMSDLVSSFRGDVDILVGQLHAKNPEDFNQALAKYSREVPDAHPAWLNQLASLDIAESGGIEWPPRTDYIVGVETKYLFLDPQAQEISEKTVRSKKSSESAGRKIRLKVKRLVDMGFDKVALLEFIGNPPAKGLGSRAWSIASGIAAASEDAVAPILEKRLPLDSVAGHWVCSVGAVAGGDETLRGSGGVKEYRPIGNNRWASDSGKTRSREAMQKNLHSILSRFPVPRYFPALYINCKPCGKLHESFFDNPCNAVYNATRHGLEEARF